MLSSGGNFNTLISGIIYLFAFVAIILLAFYATRFLGKKAGVALRGKYMTVIETISLGFDKRIHLIRVGSKYVLVATDGKSLRYLTELGNEIEELKLEEDFEGKASPFDFSTIFNKYLKRETAKNTKMGAKSADIDAFLDKNIQAEKAIDKDNRSFKGNLGKLRDIVDTKEKNY